MISMPNNDYFDQLNSNLEAKYWKSRVDDLVEGLNDLGFLIPNLTINEVILMVLV